MYKLTNTNSIIRISDGACIPNDPKNTDYAEYLKWVADGGIPLPVDPPSPQIIAVSNYKQMIRSRAKKLSAIEAVLLLKTIGE